MLAPGAGFLAQLAQHRVVGILALVDAALGHLPEIAFLVVDPLADERLARGVDQHHPDAGAVQREVELAHPCRASISFIAAMMSARSAAVLGIAFLMLTQPWIEPRISR